MASIFHWLFYTGSFMSHGHCYLWKPSLVGLHVISDISIGVAYAAISLTLLFLVRQTQREIPFHWMILAFGAFIIACGCTHFMEVWTIWKPVYWLSGGIKALTAIASVTTAIALPRLVPEAVSMIQNAKVAEERRIDLERANVALKNEVAERGKAEAAVRQLNEESEERVRARTAQLAEANQQLAEKAAIVSHSSDAIFSLALNGTIRSWNPGAEGLYGYSADEIIGCNDSLLIPDGLWEEFKSTIARIARGEAAESFETVRRRKDGTEIDVHVTVSPIYDGLNVISGFSVIGRDVTFRKRAEQQLRETQKLESLGLIAGGVAHDFNNLLVGIMGNSSLALDSMAQDDENRPLLEQILLASEKASQLTRQMLAYAGKGRFVTERIDISALVREMGDLIRTSTPKSVKLCLELQDDLPFIEGDPGQIQQLIMNLLINGAEAIGASKSGSVTVTTKIQEVDEHYLQSSYGGERIKLGTYLSLEVRDTGIGMDEATRSRIFDPFFTTKFTGRGLGLAAALGIVRAHRGTIRVSSAPGQGSTFNILLPCAPARLTPQQPPAEVQSQVAGSGTVLLVDDEQIVLETAKMALEHFGYCVLTAQDGQAGVDLFRERADEIALVLLDLTMPIMSGQEAFQQIRAVRPSARVIVSSGYDEVDAIRHFTTEGVDAFIQKPYTATKLASAVKRVLASQVSIGEESRTLEAGSN